MTVYRPIQIGILISRYESGERSLLTVHWGLIVVFKWLENHLSSNNTWLVRVERKLLFCNNRTLYSVVQGTRVINNICKALLGQYLYLSHIRKNPL